MRFPYCHQLFYQLACTIIDKIKKYFEHGLNKHENINKTDKLFVCKSNIDHTKDFFKYFFL